MTRRAALTVLAFLAAGVLTGFFVVNYVHGAPAVLAGESGGTANGGPVVDIKLTTVAAVGFGDHPNWVGYLPTTYFKVPPNATVRITIDQQDGPSGLRNPYLGLVRGTDGNSMTIDGTAAQAINPDDAAHTFSVPSLGVSVPLLGVDPTQTTVTNHIIVFSFKVPASGIYRWQCFVPCAAGTLYGLGGPMQTLGYMDGQIEVGQ